jgi:CheY-like chemotaxis protein
MGGDITVKSEYARGSVFTAIIPQLIENDTPLARVEDPETKAALVYENRPLYADSLVYTLEALGLSCVTAHTREDLAKRVAEGARRPVRQFVFASPGLFDETRELLRSMEDSGRGSSAETEPALILLSEYAEAARRDIPAVFMPLQPTAVAAVLNGKKSNGAFHETQSPAIRFTAPNARILIVDDIEINLDVAEGLLAPYQMSIDCVTKGFEALQLAQQNRYDMVLMDHMMPGMDGIETTAAIRTWEESEKAKDPAGFPGETPIIALTANAITGMKEMFLEKGFNDYISKPIEFAKMEEILTRWIPAEKQIRTAGALKAGNESKREPPDAPGGFVLPGVDVKKGITLTGGREEWYLKVLDQFRKDAAKRLDWFKDLPRGNVSDFTIQAHALKSAAATIGAAEVSQEAAVLEAAGKAGDIQTIGGTLPLFHEHLSLLIEAIGKTLQANEELKGSKSIPIPRASLAALQAALEGKNIREIDRLLAELEQLPLDAETRELINAVSDKVLLQEYRKAVDDIASLIGRPPMDPN